jgi:D-beta-D-heptose 7-phosphate kinase/D-beta-D-heptose 1-phosphate adenosyltransferase
MPTLHETARSSIIASLEDVDMVVIFQGDSPAQLLEVLHPDVHIVGANGIPDVANEDGRTLLVDLQDDFSMHGINLESISVGML